ncbi:hypothetical protein EZV62_022991 [Acer yangbiense]|uniref:Uncharacterized protein n=1 Tax=Acer yangbiense TaxID=1000413 RepID=A0A5C7H0W9_9ROSI|nr:hypothetical protein EZV62_022991 [Acer yangbiense]
MASPILLFISIIFFLIIIHRLYQRLRYNLPPGPRPWPIIGNLDKLNPVHKRQRFAEWSNTYGPIISVWFGSTLNVVISNSELAKQGLKDNDQRLADRYRNRRLTLSFKNGQDLVWADYGSHYVKVSKVCTLELFSPKSIEALRPIREDEVRAMIESIYKDLNNNYGGGGGGLVLRKYLGSVAFNNITRMVFGKKFVSKQGVMDEQGLEFKAVLANEYMLGASLGLVEHIWWLNWMSWLGNDVTLSEILARKDRLTRAIIEEHKAKSMKKNNNGGGGVKPHFVDALLGLQEKYEFSEDTIMLLLWNMITAGMDTVAIIAEWAMAELIKNPKAQQKAQQELDRVIGLDGRVMNESDISNLPYLQCIVKEAMRLHPSTPLMLPHRANSHIKIGGYDIPKGTVVHFNIWAIARDPSIWDDPLEFKPERFVHNNVDIKGRQDFRMLPFGAGRRICPGAQLGVNLVTSMIGHMLHHFEWTQPEAVRLDEIDMSESPGLACYMLTPLQAVPTPRLPAHLHKCETWDC